MKITNTIKITAWVVSFEIIGFLLGLITQANIHPWYAALPKSELTPPGWIFSVVWTILYAILAIFGWILSRSKKDPYFRFVYRLYGFQMLLNWAWTPLFFGFHWVGLSAIWLVGLTVLNILIFIKLKRKKAGIAWLLVPYIVWLIFACYLNLVVA